MRTKKTRGHSEGMLFICALPLTITHPLSISEGSSITLICHAGARGVHAGDSDRHGHCP